MTIRRKINLDNQNLAINGGKPIRSCGWLDNFTIGEEEKRAALRVMDGGYLSLFEGSHTPDVPFSFRGGPEVHALEEEWCEYYGSKHSISMNSATSGLYAAIGALDIGYGDEVIVSPYTMSACAIAPLIYGAIPVFADVELETGCLDPSSIEKLITPRTKAILVVHQFGIPADMERIMSIAANFNIHIIEDCAQAHGAMIQQRYVGTFGSIGIFSLNVNKTIQTGEGGVCITNDDDLAYRLQLIRNHGEAVVGPAEYKNITNIAGFNYRMTEMQAAIAREQLKKLNMLNSQRLELVEKLSDGLAEYDFLRVPSGRLNDHSTYYVYPLRFLPKVADTSRNDFVKAANAEGALFYQGYTQPLYLQPLYQKRKLFKYDYPFSAVENQGCRMEYEEGICPNSERLYFEEMIINEHIRAPNTLDDVADLLEIFNKVVN